MYSRREFVKTSSAGVIGMVLFSGCTKQRQLYPRKEIPLWHGFNLVELVDAGPISPFNEIDFQLIAEWGFNFVRLPLNYWNWSKPTDWYNIDENVFTTIIDKAIEYGKTYNIHVCLNLHRIPGYCVNDREKEPMDLFRGSEANKAEALKAATFHWEYIARRYQAIDPKDLSFNLINEPPDITVEEYGNVIDPIAKAVENYNKDRMLIIDGLNIANIPDYKLLSKGYIQSTRGYQPLELSQYHASWIQQSDNVTLSWPFTTDKGQHWDDDKIKEFYMPWENLYRIGCNVLIGEFGVLNTVPHEVALSFMKSLLSYWKRQQWGWALWNFRGPFGIINSNRPDVNYLYYNGLNVDDEMLQTLRSYL